MATFSRIIAGNACWIAGLCLFISFTANCGTSPGRPPMLIIDVGEHKLTADFTDNSSAAALREKLQQGAMTIEMRDYANMEKVGDLGFSLPRNDEQIAAQPGDIILYLGNSLVIYYDHNSWSLTRLARVNNVSVSELKSILAGPRLSVTLSLSE